MDTEYTDKVVVKLIVPIEKMQKLQEAVTEGTNGNAVYQLGEMVEFASIEGKIKIF